MHADDAELIRPYPSPSQNRSAGKLARLRAPRGSHSEWQAAQNRRDPVTLIASQNDSRIPELVPIRNQRLSASPFSFYRGTAAIMAADLADLPTSGISVHACGDSHLLNFGVFATAERNVVFDLNDFDEAFPAPFEWDVKRLAASFVLAAREAGFTDRDGLTAVRAAARSYRENMRVYSDMAYLDVWYARIDVDEALQILDLPVSEARKTMRRLGGRTNLGSLDKLSSVVDGVRRIRDEPPLLMHVDYIEFEKVFRPAMDDYKSSLLPYRRELVDLYRPIDVARKVVGVGSVGLEALVVLLHGRDDSDPLFLQLKEARQSVVAPFVPFADFEHQGSRVVFGQRVLQASSDILLGWMTGPSGRHYYVRQLRDMKGSMDFRSMSPARLTAYAGLCGWTLARAHARSGKASIISGYLGARDRFDVSIAEFAVKYADQAERDHAEFVAAIADGRFELPVEPEEDV